MKFKLKLTLLSFLFCTTYFAQNRNYSISTEKIEKEVKSILAGMTIEEKVGQTCQITLDALLKRDSSGKVIEPIMVDSFKIYEAIVNYKIGSVLNVGWHTLSLKEWHNVLKIIHKPFNKDLTKIPIIYGIDAIHGANYTVGATLFPQEIGLAATWNPELAFKFGKVTAYETRASGIPWNFSPVLDLGRQPLWSRTFETLGEDPYLASKLGESIVKGYQGSKNITSENVASCLKHYVGYSNPISGRDRTPAWIPDKYLNELYLPSFKKSIENGALTVMANSGVLNGIPGHSNYYLLTEILKKEWGFEGFVVSDWEDFIMLNTIHRTAKTTKEGIVQAINAGMDMSMVPYSPQYKEYCSLMIEAINDGSIPISRLDDAVSRILRVKLILGLFENQINNDRKYPKFGSKEHHSIALNTALESITLLKNENNILPLNKNQKILISGPTSNNLIFLNGAWTHTWQGDNSDFNTKGRKSIYQEFEEKLGKKNVLFSQGAELYLKDNYEATRLIDINDFKTKASISDIIILCLGEYPSTEKPGDIQALDLNPEQVELFNIAFNTGKPVIIIMLEGRPRIINNIVDKASAIVQAYLPGDFGADAIVKLFLGKENFSGKLPYSYPKFNGQIEFYDHPRSVDRHKQGFKGYNPQWDFGYGISYSNFEYSNLTLNTNKIGLNDTLIVEVDVKNIGPKDGKEVVQLYLSDNFSSMIPTGKSLKAFTKICLKDGETKTVKFAITKKDLVFYGKNNEWLTEPGFFTLRIADKKVEFELK